MLFCIAVVASDGLHLLDTPFQPQHQYIWKYALEFVEKNASADNAPVLICSDLPEADHMPMPVGAAIKDSGILPPLTYYKLSVPVLGLPRALNDEAIQIGSRFLQSTRRRERFLALAFAQSYALSIGWQKTPPERMTYVSSGNSTESRFWNLQASCPGGCLALIGPA